MADNAPQWCSFKMLEWKVKVSLKAGIHYTTQSETKSEHTSKHYTSYTCRLGKWSPCGENHIFNVV